MAEHRFETEDKLYDPAAQEKIIHLAAELQRQAATSLSRSELEHAAAEAGIEPRFVRIALERVNEPKKRRIADFDGLAIASASLLMLTNAYVITGMASERQLNFWVPFALAAIFGAVFSRSIKSRMFAYGISVAGVMIVYLWCRVTNAYGLGPAVTDQVTGWIYHFAAVQLFVILVTQGIAALAQRVRAPKREARI